VPGREDGRPQVTQSFVTCAFDDEVEIAIEEIVNAIDNPGAGAERPARALAMCVPFIDSHDTDGRYVLTQQVI
jgi:hypothetical protein